MRYYSTTAGEMILQTGVSAGDITMIVDTVAGLPVTFPFTLLVDYGTASEEVVDVTAASGATLTVVRGRDGTIAQSHGFGAKIRHGVTARDYRDSRDHEAGTGAHGVATVAGLTETQTLDNKTFQPNGDHLSALFRSKAGNTSPITRVETSAGDWVAAFYEDGLRVFDPSHAVTTRLRTWAAAVVSKALVEMTLASDVHAIVANASGGPTGKFLRLMSGVTELFSVAANGDVSGRAGTFASNVGVTGNVTATGNVTGSNITTLTATSGTHTTDIAAVDTRVTAVETNLGSQTTFAATSAGKDKKRLHWVKVTVTPNATGYATVTHGCGFTPTIVVGSAEQSYTVGVDPANVTGTTFQVRLLNPTTDLAVTTSTDVMFFCGE